MRFAVAHKVSTYLVVMFCYFALIGGGQLSPAISYGGIVAFLISWWWEAPRIKLERWGWVWTVLSIFVFAYCLLAAIVTLDFLYVGAEFLIWLTIVKAFNRRAARDWQQIYLLSFLMLVAGSVLNPDLTYGLFFFGFVITITWALTLFHLRREMEDNLLVKHAADRASERVEVRRILDSRRIVGGRFFLGTGLLSFGVFVGAAVVFLALPRVGIGFFLKSRGGLTLAGFADGVKLGGHGVIKKDSTVVMRVEIDTRYGAREAPELHWRGVAFDLYQNGQWSRSDKAPTTNQTLEPGRTTVAPTRDRRVLLWSGPQLPVVEIERLAASTVKQEIWLEPLDSNVLFGASNPRIIEYAHALRRRNVLEKNDEVRLDHGTTLHYTVYSDLRSPSPAELRGATAALPENFRVYLQLPAEITQRTRELAKQITKDAPTAYDKAIAIKQWLAANLTYTLELEDSDQEQVDFFLFERKKGHCEYFASAFAILARAVNIPVRQVNGFLGGEWNEYQSYIAVRAGDAHSWDEVFFPGVRGDGVWVTFDPTPPGNSDDLLGRGDTGWRAKMSRFLDTLRFQWTKWVIEYDLVSQLSLFKSVGRALKTAAIFVKDGVIWLKDLSIEYWPISTPLGLGLIALLVRRRRRLRAKLPPELRVARSNRKRTSVAEIYDGVAKQLTKAGFARSAGTTPRELAGSLGTHAVATPVAELIELYYGAEWGGRRDAAVVAKAEALAAQIKQTLREVAKAKKAR